VEELTQIVTEVVETINNANNRARQLLKKKHGGETYEDLFTLVENKAVTHKLLEAENLAFQSEKLDILFGSLTNRVQ
jgi:hypothetical protein